MLRCRDRCTHGHNSKHFPKASDCSLTTPWWDRAAKFRVTLQQPLLPCFVKWDFSKNNSSEYDIDLIQRQGADKWEEWGHELSGHWTVMLMKAKAIIAASPHSQMTSCCQGRFQDEMEFTAAFPSPSTHFSVGSRHNINKDPSHPHSEVKGYNLISAEIRTSSGMTI